MPRFFFHHYAPGNVVNDDLGCDFDNFELAYLDAFRGMVDIGAELIKNHEDPGLHRMEIANAEGVVLESLRFDEVFRRRRAGVPKGFDPLSAEIERNRRLRAEMRKACDTAKGLVAATRETLRRRPR